jgi:hypothetical protein
MTDVRNLPGTLQLEDVEVYAGAAPIVFTDLDLSTWTGKRSVWVMLRHSKTAHTADAAIAWRKNGEAKFTGTSGINYSAGVATTAYGMVLVKTDTNGIIEWTAGNADACTVRLEGFIYA